MCRLIRYAPFVPGEFVYEQKQGIYHKFPGSGRSITQQAEEVLKFRLANNLERATIEQVIEDIDVYTCKRLGCLPEFCTNTDATFVAPAHVQKKGGCATCGFKHT